MSYFKDTEPHTTDYSTFAKSPNQVNILAQKLDQWLAGMGNG